MLPHKEFKARALARLRSRPNPDQRLISLDVRMRFYR
jgi:hypothetical protein